MDLKVVMPMKTNAAPTMLAARGSKLPVQMRRELEDTLRAGDIVFTRISGTPFRQIADATGTWTNHVGIVVIGEVTTFRALFERNPEADLRLWKAWYFRRIPWERATLTPGSLYASPSLKVVFDGTVHRDRHVRLFSRRNGPTGAHK